MLKIKLSRIGKKGQPQYRVIIAEARSKRDGAYVDHLGHYNPLATKDALKIDMKAYQAWLDKGAQPTDTIRDLVKKHQAGAKKSK